MTTILIVDKYDMKAAAKNRPPALANLRKRRVAEEADIVIYNEGKPTPHKVVLKDNLRRVRNIMFECSTSMENMNIELNLNLPRPLTLEK